MISTITKRDGRIVPFESEKIESAIARALAASGSQKGAQTARELAAIVTRELESSEDIPSSPTVEQVQDVVERVLIEKGFVLTAKAYILYREQHARIRELTQKADVDLIDNYLDRLDWQVQENSNMSYSLQGLNNYISSEISKTYWLNKIYPQNIREAHISGDFHIHDLGMLSAYCVGSDHHDLLRCGFEWGVLMPCGSALGLARDALDAGGEQDV